MIFFITAVEMILPNNNLKKYAKFVLGLILITVLINPFIKLIDNNFNIDIYTNNAVKYFEQKGYENNIEKYKESSINNTLSVFKSNLETTCEKKLKERFPKNSYEVEAGVKYNKEKEEFVINTLKVGVKESGIEKIKKVDVSTKSSYVSNNESLNDEKSRNIRDYISEEFKLNRDSILVYKN